MKSINKVIMIGNLVANPEVVQINENTDVAKFTIAVNESYKKQDGSTQEITTYLDCEAWGGLSKVVSNYLKKGSRVYVEGALRSDTWTDADSGKQRTKMKMRLADMLMLDTRGGGNASGGDVGSSGSSESPVNRVNDEELPF
ncbi:MAG: single-stranded DNA-binding protein [Candidatus Dojkabacteria bacterium]